MMTTQAGRLNDNYNPQDINNKDSDKNQTAVVASSPPHSSPANKAKKAKGAFRTISEVADELGVQQHVLRFWETKFSQIRPLKRGGGRRYYRPEDVALLKRIYELLYTEGYTIKGVQKLFRANGKQSVMEGEVGGAAHTDLSIGSSSNMDFGTAPVPVALAETDKPAEVGLDANEAMPSRPLIHQGLSNTQKQILHAALSELKELRALVQAEE